MEERKLAIETEGGPPNEASSQATTPTYLTQHMSPCVPKGADFSMVDPLQALKANKPGDHDHSEGQQCHDHHLREEPNGLAQARP